VHFECNFFMQTDDGSTMTATKHDNDGHNHNNNGHSNCPSHHLYHNSELNLGKECYFFQTCLFVFLYDVLGAKELSDLML